MKVLRTKIDEMYRFTCVSCKSELEANREDLSVLGGGDLISYVCPVCGGRRFIRRKKVRRISMYGVPDKSLSIVKKKQ